MAQVVGTGTNTPQDSAVVQRLRLPTPKPKSAPAKRLGPVQRSEAPAPPDYFHVSPAQQQAQQQPQPHWQPQQDFFHVAPTPAKVLDVAPKPAFVADLFQQKNPLSVQIVPEQPAPAVADGGWMDGTFPASPWVISQDQAEQNAVDQYNEKARLGERDRKRRAYEAADQTETAAALTPEQWAALTPLQQASAQANADLAVAVQKDFASLGKNHADEIQFKDYQDRVKELFGEEESLGYKGIDYAPNTIAFLDARGIEATNLAGRTLDDMLSGSALVTTEIFNTLGEPEVKSPDVFHTGPTDARAQNIKFAQDLAKGQLAYQEEIASKMKKGYRLLTDITSASTSRDATTDYGAATETPTQVKLTDVRPETLAQIDKYMEALANSEMPLDGALEAIGQDLQEIGASPKETAQVWDNLMERSHQGATGGRWFDGVNFKLRSPVEVAEALGAPTLKRGPLAPAALTAPAASATLAAPEAKPASLPYEHLPYGAQ